MQTLLTLEFTVLLITHSEMEDRVKVLEMINELLQ